MRDQGVCSGGCQLAAGEKMSSHTISRCLQLVLYFLHAEILATTSCQPYGAKFAGLFGNPEFNRETSLLMYICQNHRKPRNICNVLNICNLLPLSKCAKLARAAAKSKGLRISKRAAAKAASYNSQTVACTVWTAHKLRN